MTTLAFWKQAFERAVKTAAQAVLTAWAVGDGMFNAFALDWELAGGFALGGFVFSVLTSLISAPAGNDTSPSLVEVPPPTP